MKRTYLFYIFFVCFILFLNPLYSEEDAIYALFEEIQNQDIQTKENSLEAHKSDELTTKAEEEIEATLQEETVSELDDQRESEKKVLDEEFELFSQTNPIDEAQDKRINRQRPSKIEKSKEVIKNPEQFDQKKEIKPTTSDKEVLMEADKLSPREIKEIYNEKILIVDSDPCNKEALDTLYKVAQVWQFQKKHRRRALYIFDLYTKCYPNNGDAFFELGRLSLWLGKNKEAEAALQKGLKLSPNNTDIAYLLVLLYIREKQWEKAEQVLKEYPNLPTADKDHANIAFRQRDFKKAEHHYRDALSKNSEDVDAIRGLARSLAAQKRYRETLPYYQKLVELEPKNQRNWIEYMYIRSHTHVSLLGEGSYTKAKEGDPDLNAPVVLDFYTSEATHINVPVVDRWKLSFKQTYFHQKEDDIFVPMGINYNVYIYGAQITSQVEIWKDFRWDVVLRYVGARGYNNNVFFPFSSKSLFEPGTSLIYSSAWQHLILNAHVESFIIKNFRRRISQLLRTVYLHGGYIIKPNMPLKPQIECVFDEVFYHDRVRNVRNTFRLEGKFNVFKDYLKFFYQFRNSHFKYPTVNYDTYKRQFRNTIGGIFDLTIASRLNINCVYEHWWRTDVGLVTPIGLFIFFANKLRVKGDKVTMGLSYLLRDRLKIEAGGHLIFTTFPYRDFNVNGRILWQF